MRLRRAAICALPQDATAATAARARRDPSPRHCPTAVLFVPTAAVATTILVFDSGLGGLTVFREVVKARPDARYVYVADDAFFPYNSRGETELVAWVGALMGELIETHRPDLIVIACNTASTLVLPHLRTRFGVPFVGTVPAIKPACASSRTKRVAVLGTEATVGREYTRTLIRDCANGSDVKLVGTARGLRGGRAPWRAGRRRSERAGDRALFRRCRRAAHRYCRARLHGLSAAARPLGAARALAGDLRRSRARDRAPDRRFERAEGGRCAGLSRAHRVHLGPAAVDRARRGAGAFRTWVAEASSTKNRIQRPWRKRFSDSNGAQTALASAGARFLRRGAKRWRTTHRQCDEPCSSNSRCRRQIPATLPRC